MRRRLVGHVARDRAWGREYVVYGFIVTKRMREWRALAGMAGGSERLGGLACCASALILLFNGKT